MPDLRFAQDVSYPAFNQTISLDVITRQQGEDDNALSFRGALCRIRLYHPTQGEFRTLARCSQPRLDPTEVRRFEAAPRRYSTRANVADCHDLRIREIGRAVVLLQATHTGHSKAHTVSADNAGNLHAMILVSIGMRVMLTEHLWTERGLVNGSLGTVFDIAWAVETDPRHGSPLAVLVRFEGYSGPTIPSRVTDDEMGLVPIFRSRRTLTFERILSCTREQFPFVPAYAITIHKSQGISLDRAVVSLGDA